MSFTVPQVVVGRWPSTATVQLMATRCRTRSFRPTGLPKVDVPRLRDAGWRVEAVTDAGLCPLRLDSHGPEGSVHLDELDASVEVVLFTPDGEPVSSLLTAAPADVFDPDELYADQGPHATQVAAVAGMSVSGLPASTYAELWRTALRHRDQGYTTVELHRMFTSVADPTVCRAVATFYELVHSTITASAVAAAADMTLNAHTLTSDWSELLCVSLAAHPDRHLRRAVAESDLDELLELFTCDNDSDVAAAAHR